MNHLQTNSHFCYKLLIGWFILHLMVPTFQSINYLSIANKHNKLIHESSILVYNQFKFGLLHSSPNTFNQSQLQFTKNR